MYVYNNLCRSNCDTHMCPANILRQSICRSINVLHCGEFLQVKAHTMIMIMNILYLSNASLPLRSMNTPSNCCQLLTLFVDSSSARKDEWCGNMLNLGCFQRRFSISSNSAVVRTCSITISSHKDSSHAALQRSQGGSYCSQLIK